MAICTGCQTQGYPGPELKPFDSPFEAALKYADILGEGASLLFKLGLGYYCYPCYCKATNTCFQCSETVKTLYLDDRCKSNPYVCRSCLDNKRINHLWACYGNGCMSIEEMAQEEYEMLEDDS